MVKYNYIFEKIKKSAKLAIFGTLKEAINIKHELEKYRKDIKLVCFLDSFQTGELEEIPVHSPLGALIGTSFQNTEFLALKKDINAVIISSFRQQYSMRRLLNTIGVDDENIFVVKEKKQAEAKKNKPSVTNLIDPEFAKHKKHVSTVIRRIIPQAEIKQLDISLVEHCNLKCYGCSHFAPLAEEEFVSVESVEKDLKRLSQLTKGSLVEKIHLVGGEPLLHAELLGFFPIARNFFPEATIKLITNGILLPQQSEDFWLACKKYNIDVTPTMYPLKIDWEQIEQTALKYDVKFYFHYANPEGEKTSWFLPLDENGKQNPTESFINCLMANKCFLLRDGKFYTCALPATIQHFNKYFNKDIPVTEKDYIDIHKAKNIEEILEFLAKPISFCKYCNANERKMDLEWKMSTKSINEWMLEKK